jgi:hypothetical protein
MGSLLRPRPGDFACCTVSGAGGVAITAGQLAAGYWRHPSLAKWAHAFVYVGLIGYSEAQHAGLDAHGWSGPGVYCAEAMPHGARLRRLGAAPEDAVAAYGNRAVWSTGILELDARQRRDARIIALAKLGIPYSVLDYLSLIQHHLHIPAPGLRHFIADSGHMICSQYVDWVWTQVKQRIFPDGRWSGDVMPADLAAQLARVKGRGQDSEGKPARWRPGCAGTPA